MAAAAEASSSSVPSLMSSHQHLHHYHYHHHHNHCKTIFDHHHHHRRHRYYNCLEEKHVEKEVEYMSDSVGHHVTLFHNLQKRSSLKKGFNFNMQKITS